MKRISDFAFALGASSLVLLGVMVVATAPALGGSPASPTIVAAEAQVPDWQARLELARVLSYSKQYDESLAEYRRVLVERPELEAARLEMASVLLWKGDREAAVEALKGLPEASLDAELKVLLADLYAARKEYARAEGLLRGVLATSPEDLRVRLRLADVLSWQKLYPASLTEFRAILEKRPDDVQVRRKYAYVLMWAGERDAAATELRKTLP